MAKNGLETIVISGGEPLTHPDIYKMVKHACDNLVAVKLNTNGYLLSHFAHKFKEFKNLDVQVTLNSSTPEVHEKLSNANIEGLHETVVKNINISTKLGLKILLVMNIVPENVDDIENMCKLAKNLMCEEFMIGEIELTGRANHNLYVNTSSEKIQKIYEEMNKKYDMNFLKNIERKVFLDCLVRTNCGILSEFVGIDCDGDIRLCTFARDYLKANNIFKVNLDDYFKTLDKLNIADVGEPTKDFCFNCKHFKECSHCIYQGLLMRDTIGAECNWGKSKMVTDLVDGLKSLQIKEA
jgi:MoaA/NifB/PqqE/SkfB family radical SAM enzyme